MTDFQPVLRILCGLLVLFSLCLILPLGISIFWADNLWKEYTLSMVIGLALGAIGFWRLRNGKRELQPRHGILLVIMVWLVLPIFATIPLLLVTSNIHEDIPLSKLYFEAVSALTTTGSTAISGLEHLPLSLNVWRTFMQWLGGMGILILAVAILPMVGVGGSQVFKAEASGPVKDTKLTPRIAQTAKGLWGVYCGLSIFCLLGFWLSGMPFLEALMNMFATVSLGGMSPYSDSFGHYHSPLLELFAMIVMLAASCNFALYFIAIRKRSMRGFWRDIEVQATLTALIGCGIFCSLYLWYKGIYSALDSFRFGMFNAISMGTTTGFINTNYLLWPSFLSIILLFLSGFATSAGSTGGGVKMVRVLILIQQARRELIRLAHPHAVIPVRLRGSIVSNNIIFSVLAFILLYWITIFVLSMALIFSGMDLVTAFSSVIASLHCVGPGMGSVGPDSNYASLNAFQLSVCSLAMLLGRLEILSFMVLLTPTFWRR